MPSTARRFGSIPPLVLALLLVLPGPLACQDAEGDAEETAPRQEMAADDGSEAEGPLFSEKTREVIDEQGPDAAMGELSMLMATARDDYVIDVGGLVALGAEYQAEGQPDAAVTATRIATFVDPESVDAVVALGDLYAEQDNPTMAAVYYQQALGMDAAHPGARDGMEATGGALPEIPETPERQPAAEPGPEGEGEADARGHDAEDDGEMSPEERRFAAMHEGPARDDLERFKGVYESEEGRGYWVMETCADSGYLMAGANYGDVAPWVLRSESDLEFVQSNTRTGGEAVRLTFEAGSDGQATGLMIRIPLPPAPGQEEGQESVLDLERVETEAPWDEPEGQDCITQFM